MNKHGKENSNYKHGLHGTKDYFIWCHIKQRCYNENHQSYHNYGSRGIIMFEPWIDNVWDFINYIKSLPDYGIDDYSLDRIDNDGNYEPGNLRWTSRTVQATNQRVRKNTTGYTGVRYRDNKYIAHIKFKGKSKHIGTYDTAEEALDARNQYIIDNGLKDFFPIQEKKPS